MVVKQALYSTGLTEREVEILRLVAHGLTDAEIADELGLAYRTISSYLTAIYRKIHVSSRTAAAMYAVKQGLIAIEDH